MSPTDRLRNVMLAYHRGGRDPQAVQIELLRLMTEILIDVQARITAAPVGAPGSGSVQPELD